MTQELPPEMTTAPPPEHPEPPPRTPAAQYAAAVALALLGGVFGILGAIFQEVRSGGFLLLPIIGAPVIEESLKPSGLYYFLARWPNAIRRQFAIACLAALGGLVFGLIESTMYVKVYVSEPSHAFVVYRYTVTVLLHGGWSFIAGWGVNRGLLDWAAGRRPLPRSTRWTFASAFVLHGTYNAVVIALSFAGVFDLR